MKLLKVGLAVLGFALCFQKPAWADVELSVAIPDFNPTDEALLVGSGRVALSQGGLRLTKAEGTKVAAAYYKAPVTMSAHRSFSAYFTFRITKPQCGEATDQGADGLALVIQPDSAAEGTGGGGLGYQGIPKSVAIEIDTFFNPGFKEPEKNHVGISLNGLAESVATAEAPFTLNDGKIYHAWVDYDGKSDTLQVRLALTNSRPAEPLLSHKVDLENILGAEEYVGFSASTGTCRQQHDIFSMYFNADNLPAGIDTSVESYTMAAQ